VGACYNIQYNKLIPKIKMQELVKIDPEALEVANTYLQTNDMRETASRLGVPLDQIEGILSTRVVKKYVDTVFLEVGYNNRHKLQAAMDEIIDKKLEELEETELGSTKDIAELLAMKHKMRMDELKLLNEIHKAEIAKEARAETKNVQINNYGENYASLLDKLL